SGKPEPPASGKGNGHRAEALLESNPGKKELVAQAPLTIWNVTLGWAPYAIMSLLLLLTGLVRQQEQRGPVKIGPIQTKYAIPIPTLHNQSHRDARLSAVPVDQVAVLAAGLGDPLASAAACQLLPRPEKAEFDLAWLTAP